MSNYTLKKIDGVTILFAPNGLSIADLVTCLNSSGKDAFLDLELAKYLDANTVFGTQFALASMRQHLPEPGEATLIEAGNAKQLGLSESAIKWLLGLDRGQSSETLFSMATGLDLRNGRQIALPHDADDFQRCVLLATTCSEVADFLSSSNRTEKVIKYIGDDKNVSSRWNNLIAHWDVLTTMDDSSINTFFRG